MVRKLQRKFILIVALVLFLVLGGLVGAVNGINYWQTKQKTDVLLNMLVDNDGSFPQNNPNDDKGKQGQPPETSDSAASADSTTPTGQPPENGTPAGEKPQSPDGGQSFLSAFEFSAETPFETRYFSVTTTDDGAAWTTELSHIASVTESEAEEYAAKVKEKGKSEGKTGVFRYRMVQTDEKLLIVFVDCSRDTQNVESVAAISCFVAAGCYLLVLILVILCSRKAIRPVIESMEKQKQFITDAGHELKTPIAIISANTEVIEMCEGESEWTESIHHQTERLTSLVTQLLTLAKMDEGGGELELKEWNASETIMDAVTSFEAPAVTKQITLQTDIAEELRMEGDAARIHQLVSLLVDNAVKYTPEGGTIRVRWWKNGKKAGFSVQNTCDTLPDGDLNRLFDRFYRADASRARESGGYGIGLSVAAAIVQAHKGKITAERTGDGICFKAVFPAK